MITSSRGQSGSISSYKSSNSAQKFASFFLRQLADTFHSSFDNASTGRFGADLAMR